MLLVSAQEKDAIKQAYSKGIDIGTISRILNINEYDIKAILQEVQT